jgi:hydroxyacylglutathione hydrolase
MLEIVQFPALTDNYIYLLHDQQSGETAVIDPSEAEPVLQVLKQKGWQLTYILNTHHHSDHVEGNLELKRQTACQIIASDFDKQRISGVDRSVQAGEIIKLGAHSAEVIATVGHTNGHVVYYFADSNALFCGDTLFVMGCGRLFEGSAADLWQSLQKLKALPSDTRVYCAHEYSQNNGRFALTVEPDNIALQEKMNQVNELRVNGLPSVPSTIKEELATNPFLREDSASLRKNIDCLAKPAVEVFAKLRQLKDNF